MAVHQRKFEMLCAAMLGFGQLCIMTSFDSGGFILEPVIHSIHEREPLTISPYAGYYGQAVLYAAYMITCLFSPSIIAVTNPKIILVISAVFFTSLPVGFLFINAYYFYFSSILLGVGLAFFYQGQGSYVMSHSTRETIESNVSLTLSVACCCMIFGSMILATITRLSVDSTMIEAWNVTELSHKVERRFSDMEITLLFTAFTAISALGIITFFFIPSKDVDNCIESSEKKGSFTNAFKLTCRTAVSPKMVQLIPLFVLCGLNTSFWMSVFPTALNFTMHNSNLIYLPAFYSFGVGTGEVFMGIVVSFLSKQINDFGQKPAMLIAAVCTVTYCTLIHLSTAFDAPIRPTHSEPILFYHSYGFVLIIAFICGMGDCCINSVRSVICALAMPERRAQAFSVSKLYQALGSCVLFFLSPITPLYVYTTGLPILAIIATILFFSIAKSTKTMERKLTVEKMTQKGSSNENELKF